MTKKTKILGSASAMLAIAAFSGLVAGSAHVASASTKTFSAAKVQTLGAKVSHLDDAAPDKHDCKGQNACKGKGNCKTGDNGCKGQNSCKGKGGCKTPALSLTAKAQMAAGAKAVRMDDAAPDKHDCKGQNACKGKGNCKTGDNGCKGQNSCKGKGGCKTPAL